MKHHIVLLRTRSFFRSPLSSNLAPNASIKSAAPHLLDTLRLPCFGTGIPAAEIIKPTVVEMLNVLALVAASTYDFHNSTFHEAQNQPSSRITSAKSRNLIYSRTFAAKAHKKPAIGTSATSPLIILFIVSLALVS